MVPKAKKMSPEMDQIKETNPNSENEEVSDIEGGYDDDDDDTNHTGDEVEERREYNTEDEQNHTTNCGSGRRKILEQVMLDVNRCAGRLERMRQVYFHRRDDDEPPEDLTRDLELERISAISGKTMDDLNDRNLVDDVRVKQLNPSLIEDLRNQRELKRKLAQLIVNLLEENPQLHYYQGFHDVCLTYMTMLGHNGAFPKLKGLIKSHFYTFMQPTLDETRVYLDMLTILIGLQDKELEEFLERAEVGTIFALSWVITWFSHVVPSEHDVEKIFKFLESKDPHMVLYLSAEIVLHKRENLLSMEPEMSTVHHFLCQIPRKEKLPIDELIEKAEKCFKERSPDVLKEVYIEREEKKKLQEEMKLRLQLRKLRIKAITNHLFAISGMVRSKPFIVILIAAALTNRIGWWSWSRWE